MANIFKKNSGGSSELFKLPRNQKEKEIDQASLSEKPFQKKTHFSKDLKRYEDPEGLTVTQLSAGYWFIKHRFYFYKFFLAVLMLVSVLTWSNFFYTFGHYLFFGMRADNKLLAELSQDHSNLEILMAQAPRPLKLSAAQSSVNHSGSYDFVVQAENPNTHHFARVVYVILLRGEVLARNQSLILPNERKYLLVLDVELPAGALFDWSFEIEEPGWGRISKHVYPDWPRFYQEHVDFLVENENFTVGSRGTLSEKMVLNNLSFDIHNQSAYNYRKVDLGIVLKSRGKVLGANFYRLSDFMSSQHRFIEITWPGSLSGVDEVVIEPTVDILVPDSFIRFRGSPGQTF